MSAYDIRCPHIAVQRLSMTGQSRLSQRSSPIWRSIAKSCPAIVVVDVIAPVRDRFTLSNHGGLSGTVARTRSPGLQSEQDPRGRFRLQEVHPSAEAACIQVHPRFLLPAGLPQTRPLPHPAILASSQLLFRHRSIQCCLITAGRIEPDYRKAAQESPSCLSHQIPRGQQQERRILAPGIRRLCLRYCRLRRPHTPHRIRSQHHRMAPSHRLIAADEPGRLGIRIQSLQS